MLLLMAVKIGDITFPEVSQFVGVGALYQISELTVVVRVRAQNYPRLKVQKLKSTVLSVLVAEIVLLYTRSDTTPVQFFKIGRKQSGQRPWNSMKNWHLLGYAWCARLRHHGGLGKKISR